jgi:tetratricopeptide (TPR) repeat protein
LDPKKAGPRTSSGALQEALRRADREVRPLRLNVYKKAKFASSFKLRLLEVGVSIVVAAEVTQTLILHLAVNNVAPVPPVDHADPPSTAFALDFVTQGNEHFNKGNYAEAANCYRKLGRRLPGHPDALNNLGAALCRLGLYKEAEALFRRTVEAQPKFADAHNNLGNILRWMGFTAESESLRRALELRPRFAEARASLGLTLLLLGRLREARTHFNKVLKIAPRHVEALFGLGQIAAMDGRFDDATDLYNRVIDIDPTMPSAWAALVGLRRMTLSDAAWLEGAEKIAASGIAPLAEADLRFAIGKYCDDIGEFDAAFRSYRRGNELLKANAHGYVREDRTRFVDHAIRIYTREKTSPVGLATSASVTPVFVVGMMRSGTTLVEQIISSHPSAKGVGELGFWGDAAHQHKDALGQGSLDESLRKELAEAYMRTVTVDSGGALRIVDKTTINTDHLGLIHSVFPNARIIYMRRDPIDTCLSCYFQQFSMSFDFAMDLAHYYREHRRLFNHWRSVLPRETLLEVPYAELIADQVGWTRKILDHVGLKWDERCLDFQRTKRSVVTASYWQVRQKIYAESIDRWRHYEKFIGPLRGLRDVEAS